MKTTNSLINDAYFKSTVFSKNFETVGGSELNDGLEWLNEILVEKDVDRGMIPHETVFTFKFVTGQEKYFIPGCVKIDTITYFKNNVRYSIRPAKRNKYKGSARVEGLTTLPSEWLFESAIGGCDIYIYFLPDQDYDVEINGIFSLQEVSLGQDLHLIFDKFYLTYLQYALAQSICENYDVRIPDAIMRKITRYELLINKRSNYVDLSMRKSSTLGTTSSYYNFDLLRMYGASSG